MISRETLDKIHQAIPADFYEQGIEKNLIQKFWHQKRFKVIQGVLAGLAFSTNDKILDLGCNTGYLSAIIANNLNVQVNGIDISESAIKRAKARFPNLNFVTGDISLALPYPNDYFKAVVAFDVLEHVLDLENTIQLIKKVLLEDGYLVVGFPNENILFKIIWFIWLKFKGRVLKGIHVQDFRPSDFEAMLKTWGFRKILERRSHLDTWCLMVFRNAK